MKEESKVGCGETGRNVVSRSKSRVTPSALLRLNTLQASKSLADHPKRLLGLVSTAAYHCFVRS